MGRNLWQEVLGRLPVYRDAIDSGDAHRIVEHLLTTGMLVDDSGLLSIGPEGERSYGFRHFMELTSVFTAPPLLTWAPRRQRARPPRPVLAAHERPQLRHRPARRA